MRRQLGCCWLRHSPKARPPLALHPSWGTGPPSRKPVTDTRARASPESAIRDARASRAGLHRPVYGACNLPTNPAMLLKEGHLSGPWQGGGGERPLTEDGEPGCWGRRARRAFHWPQLPGAQSAETPLPVRTAWSALHKGNADTSAPPHGPGPSLAEDCSKRPHRGSASQKPHRSLFCHINHPPLRSAQVTAWPVRVSSASSAPTARSPSLGWAQGPLPDQDPWVPITGNLHTPKLALPWSERSFFHGSFG